jgi:hypothetical protein
VDRIGGTATVEACEMRWDDSSYLVEFSGSADADF